jgi:carboxyl-terminal processing protease
MDLEDITGLIWGQAGTNVILSVMHRRDKEVVEVIVPREEMEIPVVTWAFVPNSRIAYLSLSQFSSRSNQELKQALTEVQASEATGLIVDVRGNPGGLLSQAISISSQFLNGGAVMQETNAWGDMRTFAAEVGGVAPEIPLVVLVDRGSASSAEIFAGAMQDNERGLVIGETTFGTGTVLTPFTLSDGSILLLGTSEWLTAHGRSIRNEGILPDVVVNLADDGIILSPSDIDQMTEEELLRMNDETLLEAIKVLKNCYKMRRCRDVVQDKLVITR